MIRISGTTMNTETIEANSEFLENKGIQIRIETDKVIDNVIIFIHEDNLKRKINFM